MDEHYVVAQGPGKHIDGDNVETESCEGRQGQTNKGQMASDELHRRMDEMEKEEVLMLIGSAQSLRYIVDRLLGTLLTSVGLTIEQAEDYLRQAP